MTEREETQKDAATVAARDVERCRRRLLALRDRFEIRSSELRSLVARLKSDLNTLGIQLLEADREADGLHGDGAHLSDPRCEDLATALQELSRQISTATEKAISSETELKTVEHDLRALAKAQTDRSISRPVLTREERPRQRSRGIGTVCRVCGSELVGSQRGFCSVFCQRVYMEAFPPRRWRPND